MPLPTDFLRSCDLWAIRPEAVYMVLNLLAGRVPEASTEWSAALPSFKGPSTEKVCVIPIQGMLTDDGPAWLGSSYQKIASAAESAAADPDVKRIVLAVNSPGGILNGLPEAAAALGAPPPLAHQQLPDGPRLRGLRALRDDFRGRDLPDSDPSLDRCAREPDLVGSLQRAQSLRLGGLHCGLRHVALSLPWIVGVRMRTLALRRATRSPAGSTRRPA